LNSLYVDGNGHCLIVGQDCERVLVLQHGGFGGVRI
jgi:hypothetical protein